MEIPIPPVTNNPALDRWLSRLVELLRFMRHIECDFIEMPEFGKDVDAPGDQRVRLYSSDAGGGKTKLVARFPTGSVKTIATED